MRQFLDDNFLLTNAVAEKLYHEHAKQMPIIDYHSHLPPEEIANNRQYENLTQAWLEGDHYKWRAMRANGIDEQYITGTATDEEKFLAWAETVPYTLRNPLYHWTHLELRRYFGIHDLLNTKSATEVYKQTSEILGQSDRTCVGLLQMKNVELVCTTDDPIDDLRYHHQMSKDSDLSTKVLPTFRPEKAVQLMDRGYLDKLGESAKLDIQNSEDLLEALSRRIDFFHENGCLLADISFEKLPILSDKSQAQKCINHFISGDSLNANELENAQAYLLVEVCKMYHKKGWAQQFHIGVVRNTNSRAYKKVGGDAGFDTMSDQLQARALLSLLDELDMTDQLAKTIIYNLNPRDNDLFASIIGNFQDKIPGKIQFGSGWWYMDQKTGMENQINSLSNLGLLSRFVGMLTDSRSFLSFPRHEYFRRILCNLIGTDVVNGELPNDTTLLGNLVENICYQNAKSYFRFDH